MPLVIFETLGEPTELRVDTPEGGPLAEVCDRSGAPVPFACRNARCGTCRVDVLEGDDALFPPENRELDLLDLFSDDPRKRRLACSAVLCPGSGRVRLRAVGQDG